MKKNIWIMNHYAHGTFFSKGGRHYSFAKNLLKNGYQPTIFCASTRHNNTSIVEVDKGSNSTIKKTDGIPYVFVKTSQYKNNGFTRVKNMVGFYRNLFPSTKDYAKLHGKPDVILASSVHPLTLLAGIKIAKKFGVPCICEVRDLWPEAIFAFDKAKEKTSIGKILIFGERWIYEKADALIFTKEGDTDYIKEKKWDVQQGGKVNLEKAHYINNGVDISLFNNSVKENTLVDEDLESKKFNVVYTGAIRPVNNIDKIIDTAFLMKENKDIQILIYGDGIQREKIERRVKNEELTNVKIKGYVKKQYIPYILSKSSINILNYSQSQYNWERGNSSNKLFEYMASGKPIISTVKMGYSILEKYECGIEIENSSPQELAEAILEIKNMCKEKYKQLGENGRKGVKEFDFEVLSKKLINVIEITKSSFENFD